LGVLSAHIWALSTPNDPVPGMPANNRKNLEGLPGLGVQVVGAGPGKPGSG